MKEPWFWIVAEIDPPVPHIADIQRAVIAIFPNVTLADIKSVRRTFTVQRPRMIAIYLSKMLTQHSLGTIGRSFGNRDHTTVLHSFRKIEALVKSDPVLSAEIEQIRAAI